MDLAEIRKKANRDRDDGAKGEHPRPAYVEDAVEADSGPFEQDEIPTGSSEEEEPGWTQEDQAAFDALLAANSNEDQSEEEPEPVEEPAAPPLISMPAFPASAAMEFSASLTTASSPDRPIEEDERAEEAGQETFELPERGFDPLAILMAGRAASGYGNDLATVTGDVSEAEIADYQEFLCFRICSEQYAINIMEIKEIIKPREITEVPRAPDFISGVLSLRGIIIPVFNMRKRLHLDSETIGSRERILVVSKGEELFGIQVDEVLQMVRIPEGGIEQPPAVLEGIDRDFVLGIGRHGGSMIPGYDDFNSVTTGYGGSMLILLNLGSILDVSLF